MKNLVAGGTGDPFLPRLLEAINSASEIRLASAFIRNAGLDLIWDALLDAVDRKAKVEIITGDYQSFTDPQALRRLMILQDAGESASAKVFECGPTDSFHVKAYLFCGSESQSDSEGVAFVGSSNLTKQALTAGLEWNLCVRRSENEVRWEELEGAFASLEGSHQIKDLTHFWIDRYEARYRQAASVAKTDPGADETVSIPEPNSFQQSALAALDQTRGAGHVRGLVVMATGLGKTWLAAFDCMQFNAKRVLFVAHREEILAQAENTFVLVNEGASVGRYDGSVKQLDVDILFASVQTLSRSQHLGRFSKDHFDYIIVDEFHHAAARTYLQLLSHFSPRFLLGLTATPDRTDQSDILSLCDDNLVFSRDIFDGIQAGLLSPFRYFGISDDTVDYQEISWRNGKFVEDELLNQLATYARAEHNLREWKNRALSRTLAFCVSTRHSDFMADHFNKAGVPALSVHSKSDIPRNRALELLSSGEIEVLFSVDLFSEGVDLPAIDTVMMLRPTESKIVFMQQLGRGLRKSPDTDKTELVVLDFIGNHISFFRKAEALFKIGATNRARRNFLTEIEQENLSLPEGCFVNYDLAAIDFLRLALGDRADTFIDIYVNLRDSLGRRPTLLEFFRAGGSVGAVRKEFGDWFAFVNDQDDLGAQEEEVRSTHGSFLSELLVTKTTKSFKLVLIEAFLSLNGLKQGVSLEELAKASFGIIKRKHMLAGDLPDNFSGVRPEAITGNKDWHDYWRRNPVKALLGQNSTSVTPYFSLEDSVFSYSTAVPDADIPVLTEMINEVLSYRYMLYEKRVADGKSLSAEVIGIGSYKKNVPIFKDLQIACGSFRKGAHDASNIDTVSVPISYGEISSSKNFLAHASGDSMDGGDNPISDGDLLLLEAVGGAADLGSKPGIVAVERNSQDGRDEFLLRQAERSEYEGWKLEAANESYDDMLVGDEVNIFARLISKVTPEDLLLYESLMKHEVPEKFGLPYLEGVWKMHGHVSPKETPDQFLFVNLSKQGAEDDYQYHDYFVDPLHFHWQSQNRTTPESGQGQRVINHAELGSKMHLFVRKFAKVRGKGAPFMYCGAMIYLEHSGSAPMDVDFRLEHKLPDELYEYFSN